MEAEQEGRIQYECKKCKSIIIVYNATGDTKCSLCGGMDLTLLSNPNVSLPSNTLEIEKSWLSKYDIGTSRLKEGAKLTNEEFSWAASNPSRTEEITREEAIRLLRQSYDDIIVLIQKYLDMPIENVKIVALWIIGTYFHVGFNTYPFLFINAMRGSGKTRLLKIISTLQRNGDGNVQNNISEAVTFRMAKQRGIIIDEFEQIGSKDKAVLRELLNSAYKKGAVVRRMKKTKVNGQEAQVVEEFDLYTPVALANIWGIDEVLGERCITIQLEKSDNPNITRKIEDFDTNPLFSNLKVRLNTIQCSLCSVVTVKNIIQRWNDYLDSTLSTTYTTLHYTTTLTTPNYVNNTEEELFIDVLEFKKDSFT